jgi:cytochrome o ubiquinol oxidase subunit 3
MNHATDKVTFGFWLYLMSDCVLFAGLFAVYAVEHSATFGHAGIEFLVDLPQVLAETLLLLTSSFTVGLALLWAKPATRTRALGMLALTIALGAGFVGIEAHEFMGLVAAGNGPEASAFLSSFFALVGTHGLHVTLGLVWMAIVFLHALWRGFSESTTRKLTCLALFWHFLDVIWICIFTFVYLFGLI